jgi:hypothetical protein
MNTEEIKSKAKTFGKNALLIAAISGVILSALYYIYRTYTFSEGIRAGTLIKISKKGYLFKTYEGQLNLGGSDIMNNKSIFDFSVVDEKTYVDAQNFEGKNVKIHYEQKNDAFFWQGDTDYIVTHIELVK